MNLFMRALIGAGVMLIAFIVICAVASLIILSTDDPLAVIGIGSVIALLLSAVASGIIIAIRQREAAVLVSLLSSILFTMMLLIVGLAVSGGKIGGGIILNCFSYIALSLLSAFLASRKKDRHKRA